MSVRLTSQQRRECIIETAIRLFSEKGFRGVTTRELASTVGVSEPILYQHFSTKRELYTAILDHIGNAVHSDIPELASFRIPEAGTDRQFLVNLAYSVIAWHHSNPAMIRLLMLSALEGSEFPDLLHERYAKGFFKHLTEYFRVRMAEGVFRQADPEIPAETFIYFVGHMSLDQTIFKKKLSSLSPAASIEGFIDIFMEGIKA